MLSLHLRSSFLINFVARSNKVQFILWCFVNFHFRDFSGGRHCWFWLSGVAVVWEKCEGIVLKKINPSKIYKWQLGPTTLGAFWDKLSLIDGHPSNDQPRQARLYLEVRPVQLFLFNHNFIIPFVWSKNSSANGDLYIENNLISNQYLSPYCR